MTTEKKQNQINTQIHDDLRSSLHNVVSEQEMKVQIKENLKFIANTLSKSLGPLGDNSAIDNLNGGKIFTKDGKTILDNLILTNKIGEFLHAVIRTISETLVQKVGDGSTSSVVLAYKLYETLSTIKSNNKLNAVIFKKIIDEIQEAIINLVKGYSKEIKTVEDIKFIATISANNDDEIGTLISDIYKEIGFDHSSINFELSTDNKTNYVIDNGFILDRGYINASFINQADRKTCKMLNPYIIMAKEAIVFQRDSNFFIKWFERISRDRERGLVIIAPTFDQEFINFAVTNRIRGGLNVVLVDIATSSKYAENKFFDLAAFLQANPLDREKYNEHFPMDAFSFEGRMGKCKEVIIVSGKTTFVPNKYDAKFEQSIKERVDMIDAEIELQQRKKDSSSFFLTIDDLRARKNRLRSSVATLFVGGDTEQEKSTKYYLVEDAVLASDAAIRSGYVVGGNFSLILASKELMNNEEFINRVSAKYNITPNIIFKILDAVHYATKYPFSRVLANAFPHKSAKELKEEINKMVDEKKIFNLMSNNLESISSTTLINPTLTEVEMLKASLSIISLLLTTNQFLIKGLRDIETIVKPH